MYLYKISGFIPCLYSFSDLKVYLYRLSGFWPYLWKSPDFRMTYGILPVLNTETYLIFRVLVFIYVT